MHWNEMRRASERAKRKSAERAKALGDKPTQQGEGSRGRLKGEGDLRQSLST